MNVTRALYPLAKLYWKIFRPKTFGVKVVLLHPENKHHILLIQHTYGSSFLWNLPGGGYNPRKETPESASAREVREELGIAVNNLKKIGEYKNDTEGKRDTVLIFTATAVGTDITINNEVQNYKWCDHKELIGPHLNTVARVALSLIKQKEL